MHDAVCNWLKNNTDTWEGWFFDIPKMREYELVAFSHTQKIGALSIFFINSNKRGIHPYQIEKNNLLRKFDNFKRRNFLSKNYF